VSDIYGTAEAVPLPNAVECVFREMNGAQRIVDATLI
jgi:hypothetical protein